MPLLSKPTPRCIEWAAAILLAAPVLGTVVSLRATPSEMLGPLLPTIVIGFITNGTIAWGLLRGFRLVRIILVGLSLNAGIGTFLTIQLTGLPIPGSVLTIAGTASPILASILCFLPAGRRHFRTASKGNQPESQQSDLPPTTTPPPLLRRQRINRLVALGILGVLAIVATAKLLVIPAIERVHMVDGRRTELQRACDRLVVKERLRQLEQTAEMFYLEHGVITVSFAELLRSNRLGTDFVPVAGERYPEVFQQGFPLEAVFPDGERITPNSTAADDGR